MHLDREKWLGKDGVALIDRAWNSSSELVDSVYLCQWAAVACLGFLLVTFGPVGAQTSFEFSESGLLLLNTDWHSNPKPLKLPPCCRHAHSFESFRGILPLNPRFFLPSSCSTCLSKHLTRWKFQNIALEPEILWKRLFAWAFREHFFSCYAYFTWIWTYKTHDLTDYQLTVGSFYWKSCEVIYKSQSDLNSSNSKYFPALCPPWPISVVLLFFKVSISIFCVLIQFSS